MKLCSSKNLKGLTLLEMLIAVLLLSVIFLAFSAIYVTGYRFFLTAKNKVIVGSELQYAIQHIYEHVFVGIGDTDNPPVTLLGNSGFTVNYIDKLDVANSPKTCYYRITNDGRFLFERDNDYDEDTFDESLGGANINFLLTDPDTGEQLSEFSMDGDILRIKLTAEYILPIDGTRQRLTLYSACYPRLASFQ